MDIEIQAREIMYHKNNLNQIMADYTGQPFEKVKPGHLVLLLAPVQHLAAATPCLQRHDLASWPSGA